MLRQLLINHFVLFIKLLWKWIFIQVSPLNFIKKAILTVMIPLKMRMRSWQRHWIGIACATLSLRRCGKERWERSMCSSLLMLSEGMVHVARLEG
jgi:hypothetical protein